MQTEPWWEEVCVKLVLCTVTDVTNQVQETVMTMSVYKDILNWWELQIVQLVLVDVLNAQLQI